MAKKDSGTELLTKPQTDIEFIEAAKGGITAWLVDLAAFFTRAKHIETAALGLLEDAKKWRKPETSGEQEQLQLKIQRVNKGKSVAELHWDGTTAAPGITKLLHNVHRRATARRDVTIKALNEVAAIGNKLNNDYEREATERAEAERARLQAIEDAKAETKRKKELRDLELLALKKEAEADGLSPRQTAWVEFVANGGDPLQAAIAVGYLEPNVAVKSFEKGKVAKALDAKKAALAVRSQARAVEASPLQKTVVDVQADVTQAAGTQRRTRYKATVVDAEKLIAAVFAGDIPRDVLCIDETSLNEYTRKAPAVVQRWAGVRVDEDKKVQ